LIINNEIKMTWGKMNRKYYTSKGYSFTKIGDEFYISSLDVHKGSKTNVMFLCDFCNGEDQTTEESKWRAIQNIYKYRINGMDRCKPCAMKNVANKSLKTRLEYSPTLVDTHPHLMKFWSTRNDRLPEEFTQYSKYEAIWVCKNGHEKKMSIKRKTNLVTDHCSICNSLSENFPELLNEWDFEKNTKYSPYNISYGSTKKVWWKCNKGHEWKTMVFTRTTGKTKCPFCQGRKASPEYCLAVTHPDLALEWHPKKNEMLTPFNITKGCNSKVWWICERGHEWYATVDSRRGGRGCSVCSESVGEKKIREYFKTNDINFKSQYMFVDLIGVGGGWLKFDFAIFDDAGKLMMLVEFDGAFHFDKVYIDDYHEQTKIHDERKNKYCLEKDIELLRIPYWDINHVEEILDIELMKFTPPYEL
jgi:hypothetical protein